MKRTAPKELLPCRCGTLPEFRSEWMIDFLECPNCGLRGEPFFDGANEWLIRDWNHARSKENQSSPKG